MNIRTLIVKFIRAMKEYGVIKKTSGWLVTTIKLIAYFEPVTVAMMQILGAPLAILKVAHDSALARSYKYKVVTTELKFWVYDIYYFFLTLRKGYLQKIRQIYTRCNVYMRRKMLQEGQAWYCLAMNDPSLSEREVKFLITHIFDSSDIEKMVLPLANKYGRRLNPKSSGAKRIKIGLDYLLFTILLPSHHKIMLKVIEKMERCGCERHVYKTKLERSQCLKRLFLKEVSKILRDK